MLKKRRLSQNEEAIRGILLIIVFIVGLVFLRDMLVKRGVSITMLTELDYINAAEYYMRKKYGEEFEGEYVYEDSVYVHPKSKPEWHVVVDFYSENGLTYFGDNYVGYLKKAELEKYIYELVKPIYGECKVYTQPFGLSLDDSWDKNIDIMTYVKSANYDTFIFTYKENNEKEIDFNRVCDIFLKEELQSNGILVTYITQQDFDNMEEKKIDYIFNSDSYYYRVDVMYSKNTKKSFSDISILKGNDNYGK